MPYYLIHRFGDAKAPQYRKQPFSTEAEAIMRARSLIEAEEQGDFIVEDEEGRVVANDEDIRIPILQTLPTSQVTSPGIGGGGMLPPGPWR